MRCKDCPYYWKEESESHPHCQFGEPSWLDVPPCEQEDIDRERELEREYWEDMKRDWN